MPYKYGLESVYTVLDALTVARGCGPVMEIFIAHREEKQHYTVTIAVFRRE